MSWKIKNSSLDPSTAMLRRRAARLSTEPLVCGRILRVRDVITVSDEAYERDRKNIEACVAKGVVCVERVGGSPEPAPVVEEPVVPDYVEHVVSADPEPVSEPISEPEPVVETAMEDRPRRRGRPRKNRD